MLWLKGILPKTMFQLQTVTQDVDVSSNDSAVYYTLVIISQLMSVSLLSRHLPGTRVSVGIL